MIFRIETLERWPRRVVYELEATCIEAAIAAVRSHSAEPVEDEHLLNESDEVVEFSFVEHIDEPKPSPSLPAEPPKPTPLASTSSNRTPCCSWYQGNSKSGPERSKLSLLTFSRSPLPVRSRRPK